MWFKKPEPEIIIKTIEVDRELNEQELAGRLAMLLGDTDSVEMTKDATKEIFTAMGGIDGILDYLRDTMVADVKRYFAAQNDHDRDIIRGGFSRTAFLRSQIIDSLK